MQGSTRTGNSRRKEAARDRASTPKGEVATRQRTFQRGSNPSSHSKTSHSTRYRSGRRKLYGRSSPYFLPHNLYFDLRGGTFSPSIYQFSALSRITGYRLTDWLRFSGLTSKNIPRLQTSCRQAERSFWIRRWPTPMPGFHGSETESGTSYASDRAARSAAGAIWLQATRSLSEINNRGFLYAKIGYQDALAFPDLFQEASCG